MHWTTHSLFHYCEDDGAAHVAFIGRHIEFTLGNVCHLISEPSSCGSYYKLSSYTSEDYFLVTNCLCLILYDSD